MSKQTNMQKRSLRARRYSHGFTEFDHFALHNGCTRMHRLDKLQHVSIANIELQDTC